MYLCICICVFGCQTLGNIIVSKISQFLLSHMNMFLVILTISVILVCSCLGFLQPIQRVCLTDESLCIEWNSKNIGMFLSPHASLSHSLKLFLTLWLNFVGARVQSMHKPCFTNGTDIELYQDHKNVPRALLGMCREHTLKWSESTYWNVPRAHLEMCQEHTLKCAKSTH